MSFILRAVGALLVGAVAWAVLGYLATVPLGAVFGWSGHPALPDAPAAVYVGLYLVVLPALCFFGAWQVMRWAAARRRDVT
jgi:hypothetical protein